MSKEIYDYCIEEYLNVKKDLNPNQQEIILTIPLNDKMVPTLNDYKNSNKLKVKGKNDNKIIPKNN